MAGPAARRRGAGVGVVEQAGEDVGQRRLVAGIDERGGAGGHVGHRRAPGGDEDGAAGQRLERRQAEALLERRVGDGLGPAEQGGHASRRPRSRARTTRSASPARRTALSTSAVPQPSRPASTSRTSGRAAGQRGEGPHQASARPCGARSSPGRPRTAASRRGRRGRRGRPPPAPARPGRKRSWSTPCGIVTSGAGGAQQLVHPPGGLLAHRDEDRGRGAPPRRIMRRKKATLERSCHSGWSKNVGRGR